MTHLFGDGWGSDLEVGKAAQAWAALGLVANEIRLGRLNPEAAFSSPIRLGLGSRLARELPQADGLMRWAGFDRNLRHLAQREISPERAQSLWLAFRAGRKAPLRFVADSENIGLAGVLACPEVAHLLLRPETGIDAFSFPFFDAEAGKFAGRKTWRWPLRVGFLKHERSHHQAAARRWRSEHEGFFDFFVLGEGGEACDLLLCASGLEEALIAISAARARASAIAFLGGPATVDLEMLRRLPRLREAAEASAFLFLAGPMGDGLHGLLQEISRFQPLDVAVQLALRHGTPPALVFADAAFLSATRLPAPAGMESSAAEHDPVVRGDPRPGDGQWLGKDPYDRDLGDLDQGIRGGADSKGYLEEAPEESATTARYLQAETFLLEPIPAGLRRANRPARKFERDSWHLVDLHVGPLLDGARSALRAFPESAVDWSGEVTLRVVLVGLGATVVPAGSRDQAEDEFPDPALLGGAAKDLAEQPIKIKKTGASGHARFLLHASPDAEVVEARVLLVHENRILQTAILSARAAEPGEVRSFRPQASSISLAHEGTVHPSLADLDDRMRFDGAFLVDQTSGSLPLLTAITSQRVAVAEFREGKEAGSQLRDRLDRLVLAPDSFLDPNGEAFRALLVSLAREGVLLFDRMLGDNGLENKLGEPGARIQLVQTSPEAYVPLELAYDGYAPAWTADLCPNREQALDSGSCGPCPHRAGSDYVCPARFWGLNRILERHLYRPGPSVPENEPIASEPLLGRPRFPIPAAALFARSLKAEAFPGGPDAIASLQVQLGKVVGQCHSADTWVDWKRLIKNSSPPLLLLLPHTAEVDKETCLEIGAQDLLGGADINPSVVGNVGYPKMVLLLGCDTADLQLSYANFTTRFRHAKADIVVGTLSSVLGRHVAPVATALLEALREPWQGGREMPLGEILAGLRRSFMKKGLPIGLTLIAYGDADWVLGA